MKSEVLPLLGPPLATFLISAVLTKIIIVVARKGNLVAKPTEDRWHKIPTPIFGGIAIFLSFVTSVFLFRREMLADRRLAGLLLGGGIMFLMGLVDDVVNLRPKIKLCVQILAALVVSISGIYFKMFSPILMIPLTIFWIIGITNAFNLLDNMDGLSAGIASIVCLNVFFYDILGYRGDIAYPCLLLMSAMLGFLIFNFNPAKIFMGDSGAMFIGFTVASLTILGSNRDTSNASFNILFPLMIMAVPIFDTTLVSVLRSREGRKVSVGGRDHSSHRLVALGLSERDTVLLLYMISLLSGGLIISFNLFTTIALVVIAILLTLLLFYFGRFLAQAKVYPQNPFKIHPQINGLPRRLLTSALINHLPSAEILVDLLLVGISLLIGYLVKFDGSIPKNGVKIMLCTVPIMIPIKLASLYYFGVYKQLWRYMSMQDLLNILKAITVGSVVTAMALWIFQPIQGFSNSVLFLDWLIFLILVAGSRLAIVFLRDTFLRIQPQGNEIIIYGAGDAGDMLVQEIYNNPGLSFRPVAFFDDDPNKRGKTIQGVPIVGEADQIPNFVMKEKIDKMIIAMPSVSDDKIQHVFEKGIEANMEMHRFIPSRIYRLERRDPHRADMQKDFINRTIVLMKKKHAE